MKWACLRASDRSRIHSPVREAGLRTTHRETLPRERFAYWGHRTACRLPGERLLQAHYPLPVIRYPLACERCDARRGGCIDAGLPPVSLPAAEPARDLAGVTGLWRDAPEASRPPHLLLNSTVLFCVAACKLLTDPSRCTCIPTWGREQARYRLSRSGLFFARGSARIRSEEGRGLGPWPVPSGRPRPCRARRIVGGHRP